MKVGLFSPLLVLLILSMIVKAFLLFGRVQEQTTYATDTHVSSMIIDTAYLKRKEGEIENPKDDSYKDFESKTPKPYKTAASIMISSAEATTPSGGHSSGSSGGHSGGEGGHGGGGGHSGGEGGHGGDSKKKDSNSKAKPTSEETILNDLSNPEEIAKLKKANAEISSDLSINNLSKSELTLLKELAKRREKIEQDQKTIDEREQVLKATENKIDQKVNEMKQLQANLEQLMKQYDQKENSKIMSLVKIYENMKPKDAANIFNELEMPILLKVIGNMKEVKVAPIIASMSPEKARQLSIEIAKQKPINAN